MRDRSAAFQNATKCYTTKPLSPNSPCPSYSWCECWESPHGHAHQEERSPRESPTSQAAVGPHRSNPFLVGGGYLPLGKIWKSVGMIIPYATMENQKYSKPNQFLLVIPISRMLFNESTPSIFESNWFTMLSCTPVPSRVDPRDLQIESISSKITTCKGEFSPKVFSSFSASANKFLIFSSACPTYLFRTSGPFTILGSAAFRNLGCADPSPMKQKKWHTMKHVSLQISHIYQIQPFGTCPPHLGPPLPRNFASFRAINVFPVPGGPCSSMPLTWLMPRSRIMCGGKTRAAKARRKMSPNCLGGSWWHGMAWWRREWTQGTKNHPDKCGSGSLKMGDLRVVRLWTYERWKKHWNMYQCMDGTVMVEEKQCLLSAGTSSLLKPPMPKSSKLKSGLKILRCWILLLNTWSLPDGPCWKSKSVSAAKRPLFSFWAAAAPSPKSLPNPGAYSNWNIFMWSQGFPEPPVFYLFLRW